MIKRTTAGTLAAISAVALPLAASATPVGVAKPGVLQPSAARPAAYCLRRSRVVNAPAAYGYAYGAPAYPSPAYPYAHYGYAAPGGLVGEGLGVIGAGADVVGEALFGAYPYRPAWGW